MSTDYKPLAQQLLKQTSTFSNSKLIALEPLAGDASGREFFRVRIESTPVSTAVLLIPGKTQGPVSSAGDQYLQDETYLHIGKFLWDSGVKVPEIYAADGTVGAFLVEDIGDLPLWHFPFGVQSRAANAVSDLLGAEKVQGDLFKKAIDIIAGLQSITPTDSCIAFKRQLGFAELIDECLRFITFYAQPENFSEQEIHTLSEALHLLCDRVSKHPRTLIHRDFMPWNIHVTGEAHLRIIDFQDACLGPSLYDLVSLLHDRDVDHRLGAEQIGNLLSYYQQRLNEPEDFRQRYFETILQRHFRLAGQFRRLTEKTGRQIYADWVPGCLERIGKTLAHMNEWSDVLNLLASKSPDIERGASHPWPF